MLGFGVSNLLFIFGVVSSYEVVITRYVILGGVTPLPSTAGVEGHSSSVPKQNKHRRASNSSDNSIHSHTGKIDTFITKFGNLDICQSLNIFFPRDLKLPFTQEAREA